MFNSILQFLKDIFRSQNMYDNLEAYIAAHNPQNAADVDRLERQFHARNRNVFDRYY